MDEFLDKFHFLKSRKFWAFIGGVISILSAAFQADVFPVTEVITGITALVLGYMGTTAWEDTAMKKALAAPTTTIETPSENISISTSDTGTSPQPVIPGRLT
jgi:hypothetical protein